MVATAKRQQQQQDGPREIEVVRPARLEILREPRPPVGAKRQIVLDVDHVLLRLSRAVYDAKGKVRRPRVTDGILLGHLLHMMDCPALDRVIDDANFGE